MVATAEVPPAEIETSGDAEASQFSGELTLEYPPAMEAETNDTVQLSIRPLLINLRASPIFEEILVPDLDPLSSSFDDVQTYSANIDILDQMRVELSSQSFQVDAKFPAGQTVSLTDPNRETIWVWDLKAPPQPGVHQIFIEVYLGNSASPSWLRSVSINVSETPPTPTATFAPTATPNVWQSISNDPVATVVSLFDILGGVLAVLAFFGIGGVAYFRRRGNASGTGTGSISPPSDLDRLQTAYLMSFQQIFEDRFDLDETKDLLSALSLRYSDFEGGLSNRTLELLHYLNRRNRLEELTGYLSEERADIELPVHPLAAILTRVFNRPQLRQLCHMLAVPYQGFTGDTGSKNQQIISYLAAQNRLQDLVDHIKKNRPDIDLHAID